ncbi:MAG: nicotinate-nucleotide adenylyltransferase [Roseburia sp.]|nr:nicotinate-nucleotide adenylyltransferase [Roseburia sp.]
MAKIGIMGGTFDPIHMGHLLLAEYARSECSLDEIWFIPTGYSYMKNGDRVLPGKERLHMVELALLEADRSLRCLDLEVKREGNTYTCDTLEYLRREYPQHSFYFIMGADCLETIEEWEGPERIFACCEVLAAVRDDADYSAMRQKKEELEQRYGARITLLSFLRMELSSSLVRERVSSGKSIRFMVPDAVLNYIEEKGLYKNENTGA